MLLMHLNSKEKEMFLELASAAVNCNEEMAGSQEEMMLVFREEADLPPEDYTIRNVPLDEILSFFKESPTYIQRIVFLEMMSIITADGEYRPEEKDFIEKIKVPFEISDEQEDDIICSIKQISEAYAVMEDFVNA